jgi:hypothetical protein
MAIGVVIPEDEKPTLVRIWKIVINNGMDNPVATVVPVYRDETESVPVLSQGGDPVLDENGDPVLDENGDPVLTVGGDPVLDENGNPVMQEITVSIFDHNNYHAEFQAAPSVDLIVRGVWPLNNPETGVQLLNPLGQPAYINSRYIATITLPISELAPYLGLWENMMTISYEKVNAKVAGGSLAWEKM